MNKKQLLIVAIAGVLVGLYGCGGGGGGGDDGGGTTQQPNPEPTVVTPAPITKKWVVVRNNDQYTVAVEVPLFDKTQHPVRQAWVQWVYTTEGQVKLNLGNVKIRKDLLSVNCVKNIYRIEEILFYDLNGSVIATRGQEAIDTIVPDSVGEAIFTFICAQ